jgi:hypothetical protein
VQKATKTFLTEEHPELDRLGFLSEQRKRKKWYAFEVDLSGTKFLVSGTEHENQEHWGFVTFKLSWMSNSAEFFITSDPGKSIP